MSCFVIPTLTVIPAQAGDLLKNKPIVFKKIPACAGMTNPGLFRRYTPLNDDKKAICNIFY